MRRVLVLTAIGLAAGAVAAANAATGGPPEVGPIDATFAFPVSTYVVPASDPDGDELTFTWTKNGSPCGSFRQEGDTARWAHPDASAGGDCPNEPVHKASIAVVVSDGSYSCRVDFPNGSGVGTGPTPAPCRALASAATAGGDTATVAAGTPAAVDDGSLPLGLIGGIAGIGLLAAGGVIVVARRRRPSEREHAPLVPAAALVADCDGAWDDAFARATRRRTGLHDPLLQTSATLVGGVTGALASLAAARRSLERLGAGVAARLHDDDLDVSVVQLQHPVVRIVLHGGVALDELVAERAETSARRSEARSRRLGAAPAAAADDAARREALAAAYRGEGAANVPPGSGPGLLVPTGGGVPDGGAFVEPVRRFNEPDAVVLRALHACGGDPGRLGESLGPERAACLAGCEGLVDWLPALSAIDQAGPDEPGDDAFEGWADLEGSLDRSPVVDVHGVSGRAAVRAVAASLGRDLAPPAAAATSVVVGDTLAEAPKRLRQTAESLRDHALGELAARTAREAERDADALRALLDRCSGCGREWSDDHARQLAQLDQGAQAAIGLVEDVAAHVQRAAQGLDLLADALEAIAACGDGARTARVIEAAQGLLLLELSSFQHTILPVGTPPPPAPGLLTGREPTDEGG